MKIPMMMALLLAGLDARGETSPSLEQRVKSIEENQAAIVTQMSRGEGRVRPFLGDEILFGGFLDTGFVGIAGPDMTSQVAALSNLFGLNIAAELGESFRFNSQLVTVLAATMTNPNTARRRISTLTLLTLATQAYVEYAASTAFTIQGGLGYVPFGVALQQREPVLFRRRNGPQLTASNSSDGFGIAGTLWSGIHLLGSLPAPGGEGARWGYNVYTFTPTSNLRTIGAGSRLWWGISEALTVGVSGQLGSRAATGFGAYGADVTAKAGPFALVVEVARNESSVGNPWSVYVEPYVTLDEGQWVVYGVADYIENPLAADAGPPATADPHQRWQFGGGVNWLPRSSLRIRLGYLLNDYVGATAVKAGLDRDYHALDLSAGVAF